MEEAEFIFAYLDGKNLPKVLFIVKIGQIISTLPIIPADLQDSL